MLQKTYVFSSIQSASLNPFRDGSCNLFQRADFKQLRLQMLFSNLAQVADRRAFIGQNQHQTIDFGVAKHIPKNLSGFAIIIVEDVVEVVV